MFNPKEFYKKHQTKILLIGSVALGAVGGILIYKKVASSHILNPKTQHWISWPKDDQNGSMPLAEAQTALTINNTNDAALAIVKVAPEAYQCIMLSDDVVIPTEILEKYSQL